MNQRSRKLLVTLICLSAGALFITGFQGPIAMATTSAVTANHHTQPDSISKTTSAHLSLEPENQTTTVTTTTESETHNISFGRVQATVLLNCTDFVMTVHPPTTSYLLTLRYLDLSTSQQIRFMAGPLVGPTEDPFRQNGFLLLEAEVHVAGAPSVAVHIPRRCL